jgi:hypothetical protein
MTDKEHAEHIRSLAADLKHAVKMARYAGLNVSDGAHENDVGIRIGALSAFVFNRIKDDDRACNILIERRFECQL